MEPRFSGISGVQETKPTDPLKEAMDGLYACALAHRRARQASEMSRKQLEEAISGWQDAEQKLRQILSGEVPPELKGQPSPTQETNYHGYTG